MAINIEKKSSYVNKDGSWQDVTGDEILKFITLLLYIGIVEAPSYQQYWTTKSLFCSLWARVMPQKRFKALLVMLHVVDPGAEEQGNKLHMVFHVVSTVPKPGNR